MSYILDALRKADAERQRGAVPDLHAQMPPPGNAASDPAPPRAGRAGWLVAGALLLGAATAAWWFVGRQPAPSNASTARIAQAPAVVSAPASPAPAAPAAAASPAAAEPAASSQVMPAAPAAAADSTTPPVAPATGSAATPALAATPAPKPPSASPARREAPPPKAVARAKPAPALPATGAAPSGTTASKVPDRVDSGAKAAVAAAPAAASAPSRVPSLAELPGDLRQQVPAMSIGGSVYSPQASARMIVVNGQVFQEGNALTPELTLEQIRPKSAVFTIRGQRFEVPL